MVKNLAGRSPLTVRGNQLEIVSVLYGGMPTLRETLPTWVKAAEGTGVNLRFIDNSATADAKGLLLELSAGTAVTFEYTHYPSNPGFASSANRAVRSSTSTWAFLVNPDVYLERSAIDEVLAYIDEVRDLQPAAVSLNTGGVLTSGIVLTGYGFFADRTIPSKRACLGPSGGAAVLPVSEFRLCWSFDEDLFAWGEDAGLAVRLFTAGIRTNELDLRLEHVGGHSVAMPEGQKLKARLLARNRILVLRRDFSILFQSTVGVVMVSAMILNGLRKAPLGTARAHFDGMREGLTVSSVPRPVRPRMGLTQYIRYFRTTAR